MDEMILKTTKIFLDTLSKLQQDGELVLLRTEYSDDGFGTITEIIDSTVVVIKKYSDDKPAFIAIPGIREIIVIDREKYEQTSESQNWDEEADSKPN